MTYDREQLIVRLKQGKNDALLRTVRELLAQNDVRLVSPDPARPTVSEALRLWRTRLANVESRGERLEGASSLLHSLEALTPQRKLEQFAFIGAGTAGNIFFEGPSLNYVGAVLVRH